MLIQKEHGLTGTVRTLELDITVEQFENWQNGMLIQDAMPNLTADEREFLITGLLPHEWDEFMDLWSSEE
jgi:hypothetical protein